jgi:hypothetical protein
VLAPTAGAVLLRPDPPSRRHHVDIELRVRNGVAVEFHYHTLVELRQLARDLCQIEPLLPSMQTVRRGVFPLRLLAVLHVLRRCIGTDREPLLEVLEQRGMWS